MNLEVGKRYKLIRDNNCIVEIISIDKFIKAVQLDTGKPSSYCVDVFKTIFEEIK